MKLLSKVLPDDHNLVFFGDVHTGSVLSAEKGWKELVAVINSDYEGCLNTYAVDGGDMIEAILVDDPRFSPERLSEPLPLEQLERAIEMRQPIKDRLLCILMGNHERRLWRFGNITQKVCDALGVPYGTYTAKIAVRAEEGRLMYKTYVTHGLKTITSTADDPVRRQTNMKLILKRHLKFKAGDCAVMIKHHAHKLLVCEPESDLYLTDDGRKVKQAYTKSGQAETYIHPDARWYGCAGSFLRLFGKDISGYAEVAEYDPVELGFLVLTVRERQITGLKPYRLKL